MVVSDPAHQSHDRAGKLDEQDSQRNHPAGEAENVRLLSLHPEALQLTLGGLALSRVPLTKATYARHRKRQLAVIIMPLRIASPASRSRPGPHTKGDPLLSHTTQNCNDGG